MRSPVILSLESATLGGSVYLGRGDEELALRIGDSAQSHSNTLLRDIDSSLVAAGISLQAVDLFACASGPGSFTGLRIGIATVKALAAALQKPCVGIPTLQAIAYAAGPSAATVALLPAGRGEVFAQMFSVSNSGEVIELDGAAHLPPQKLVERYAGIRDLNWAGSGAATQRDFLKNYAESQQITFTEAYSEGSKSEYEPGWKLETTMPDLARQVAALAWRLFQRGLSQSPSSLSAFYVRPSDAEMKKLCP